MADAKRTYPKFTSPRLNFKFPKLNEPDYGTKEYPNPDGSYSVKGVLKADSPEAQAFIAKLQPHYDAAIKAAEEEFKELKVETRKKLGGVQANDLFTTLYDPETEEPTGEIEFKFAMRASGEYKKGPKTGKRWTRSPDIYDAKGNLLRKVPAIGGGTIGKVSFEASPYFIKGTGVAGLKLSLLGVQVIELRSYGQRSAADHGFGEEDGYEADTSGFDDETEGVEEGAESSIDAGDADF